MTLLKSFRTDSESRMERKKSIKHFLLEWKRMIQARRRKKSEAMKNKFDWKVKCMAKNARVFNLENVFIEYIGIGCKFEGFKVWHCFSWFWWSLLKNIDQINESNSTHIQNVGSKSNSLISLLLIFLEQSAINRNNKHFIVYHIIIVIKVLGSRSLALLSFSFIHLESFANIKWTVLFEINWDDIHVSIRTLSLIYLMCIRTYECIEFIS